MVLEHGKTVLKIEESEMEKGRKYLFCMKTNPVIVCMVSEKDRGRKMKEMAEDEKTGNWKKAGKPKKKSGEASKNKLSSKKEEKPMESSKEKKPARKKKGEKIVPGWGLTRGVHPPRSNIFDIDPANF